MVRTALVALALSIVATGSASAATVEVDRSDGRQAQVQWPLQAAATTLAPGTRLRVEVKQRARGAVRVTARLDRLGAARTTLRTKRLRRGVFAVNVPAAPARYALVLAARGKVVRRSVFTVAPPAPAPPAHGPVSMDGDVVFPCRADTQPTGELDDVASAGTDETLGTFFAANLRNTGTACIGHPTAALERLEGDAWVDVPIPSYPMPAVYVIVQPGAASRVGTWLTADQPAGEYRLVVTLPLITFPTGPSQTVTTRLTRAFTYGGIAPGA